jgi:sugar O-acyltransferase (sialic acid O-acetyltransferase NeuD family)
MSLKQQLIIVGAGNLGRELLCWAKDIPRKKREWEIKGFIDDNVHSLDGYLVDVPLLSKISDYQPQSDDLFVCAIANPQVKLKVCMDLEEKGAIFTNVIHPTSIIGSYNRLGKGIVMCPYSVITSHVTIGNHVTINLHSTIGHDAILEDGVTLSAHCDVTGFVHLCKGVFLGSGARLLPKARAEEFSTIGAGCVVLKHVKAHKTVFGVPAKYLN